MHDRTRRASKWKAVSGGLLATTALGILIGSTLDDRSLEPTSAERAIVAAVTFACVPVLQWLIWRFLVPARLPIPGTTHLLKKRPRGDFFHGVTGFGYLQVAIYCLISAGLLELADANRGISFLILGTLLIGIGMAARLREIILELAESARSVSGSSTSAETS